MERKAFENNQVLLWGMKPVKKSLLEEFDKGNKNPHSLTRKKEPKAKEEVKVKKEPVKRVFSLDEDYGVQDLPFLNKEYERIEKELSKTISREEMDDLTDQQDKLYELIEGLEAFQKMSGKSIVYKKADDFGDDDLTGTNIIKRVSKLIGKGFKKGSPEAKAHAEKMRKVLEERKGIKKEVVKKETKSRVEKGSEQAKELGRKLAEAKRKKAEEAKKDKEEPKTKHTKAKPWYYIGDIPKGYREATEDEAIINNKVSEYGKYVVDEDKWILYRDYDILLSDKKTDNEMTWYMNSLKKRILSSLQEIEILESKLENDKYKDKWTEIKNKLANEKEKRKYLQAGWNWYYKIICLKTGRKYERQKFELPKRELSESQLNIKDEYKSKFIRPIDPRTGKPAEYESAIEPVKQEPKHKGDVDVELYFEKDGDLIKLSTKYFTQDYKLKSKYVKQLLDKGIILNKKHYTTEDFNKYFYSMKGGNIGYGLINMNLLSNKRT